MDISIIIPTMGNRSEIKRTLDSLSRNTTNFDYEVIIVNNGTTDLHRLAHNCDEKLSLSIVKEAKAGLHYARNKGVKNAKGNIIGFLDDDVIVKPTWIEAVVSCFKKEKKVGFIGGKVIPDYEKVPPHWLNYTFSQNKEGKSNFYLSLIDLGDEGKYCSPEYIIGCNMAIRKALYLKIGGSHPDLMPKEEILKRGDGETYIGQAVKSEGYLSKYLPKMEVSHLVSNNRMTKRYIYSRSFYQAYEDLFTHFRSEIRQNINLKGLFAITRKILSIIFHEKYINTFSLIKSKFYNHKEASKISFKNMINSYYVLGSLSYTINYLMRPSLREWVHKKTFLK